MLRKKMPAELVTVDTIHVPTTEGAKQIELLFGDITQLAVADGVDMIMVSAFPGDYVPARGTVIGALRKMGLSVGEMAKDKAEDLRQLFFCWWSQLLPNEFPYRRLLCFETSRTGSAPQTAVNDVFRALISASFLFPTGGGSIISPLLSTGNQGHSSSTMLRAMVDAAANWMQCGLNVSTLKIVVYSPSDDLRSLFGTLKRKWEKKVVAPVDRRDKKSVSDNLYLCYHQHDATRVEQIKEAFHEKSPAIKMVGADSIDTEQEEWMLPVSAKMKNYRRVVVFLSPAYVNDETCVQLYNLALCTSRLMGPGFFSPFYIDTVAPIPTYMTMVQWIDARIFTNGGIEKMMRNVSTFIQGLFTDSTSSPSTAHTKRRNMHSLFHSEVVAKVAPRRSYDVFISYSHKDTDAAELILKELKSSGDAKADATDLRHLKVFYDRNDLHVGTSWQLTLYDAVQSAQVVVALLSDSYLQSAMCQEELALSVARHCSLGSTAHLVPVLLDNAADSDELLNSGRVGRPLKACRAPRSVEGVMTQLCSTVRRLLGDDRTAQDDKPDSLDARALTRSYRLRLFEKLSCALVADDADRRTHQSNSSGTAADPDDVGPPSVGGSEGHSVLIIACPEDGAIESRLRGVLQAVRLTRCSLTVLPPRAAADERTALGGATLPPKPARYRLIDEADIIVALVSGALVESAEDYEELHVAILRQRKCRGRRVLYPVLAHDLPQDCPLYLSLLPYVSCASDDWWSCRGTPLHALGNATAAVAVASGVEDNGIYQPAESCAEFCRCAIELDLRGRTPISTPGCFGDVLLNIVSVHSWLSSLAATTSGDASIDKTSRSGVHSGDSLAAHAAPEIPSLATQFPPAAQPVECGADKQSGDVRPAEERRTNDAGAQRTSTACRLL